MTRGTGEPIPERSHLSGGTGNTGVPCESPGCRSKNARARVDWAREGLDDRAADQSLRTLCDKHKNARRKRATATSKSVPKQRNASQASAAKAPRLGRTAQPAKGPPPKVPNVVVRLQRALERATSALSSDPRETARICREALWNETDLRTSGDHRLVRLMDDFGDLRRRAQAAQRTASKRGRTRDRRLRGKAKPTLPEKVPAGDGALDESRLKGARPGSMPELIDARRSVVALLNAGRDRETVRLCSMLLATRKEMMSAAGEEGERMLSFLKACRTEAYDNMRAKGTLPPPRADAARKPRLESPESRSVNGLAPAQPKRVKRKPRKGRSKGRSVNGMVPVPREKAGEQLRSFAETGIRYSKALKMIEHDPRNAVSMCDKALKELNGLPDREDKREVRACWSRLRHQAIGRVKGRSPRRG